jgi:hypothetical protein
VVDRDGRPDGTVRGPVLICESFTLELTARLGILGSELQTLRFRTPYAGDGVMLRRRFKQTQSLEERLAEEAKRLREEANLLPPGAERDAMLRKARQAETGSDMSDWLSSPGLRPPE